MPGRKRRDSKAEGWYGQRGRDLNIGGKWGKAGVP